MNFPTRRYYVDSHPAPPEGEPFLTTAGSFRAPFASTFGDFGVAQYIAGFFYDRERRRSTFANITSLPRPGEHCNGRALCWQTQVVAFSQRSNQVAGLPSDILGSRNFLNILGVGSFQAGWIHMLFAGVPGLQAAALRASEESVVFHGLPATGFLATNYDNEAAASGVLANYSALFRHRSEPPCSAADLCQ